MRNETLNKILKTGITGIPIYIIHFFLKQLLSFSGEFWSFWLAWLINLPFIYYMNKWFVFNKTGVLDVVVRRGNGHLKTIIEFFKYLRRGKEK